MRTAHKNHTDRITPGWAQNLRRKQAASDKGSQSPRSEEVADRDCSAYEAHPRHQGTGRLERERSRERLKRFLLLPPPWSISAVTREAMQHGWQDGAIKFI